MARRATPPRFRMVNMTNPLSSPSPCYGQRPRGRVRRPGSTCRSEVGCGCQAGRRGRGAADTEGRCRVQQGLWGRATGRPGPSALSPAAAPPHHRDMASRPRPIPTRATGPARWTLTRRTRHPVMGRRRRMLLSVFAGLLALNAWYGAVGLATGWLSIGDRLTARLPYGSAVLGGAALAVVVAVPATILAAFAVQGAWTHVERATFLMGTILVTWILVGLAFVREVS